MRPSKDQYFINMAKVVATRATCPRRSVGCVLVSKRGHVIGTGYNGVASGLLHCNTPDILDYENGVAGVYHKIVADKCEGFELPPGVPNKCQAIHAEQNALLQCRDVYDIETCYTTLSPCLTCVKLLMNTSCSRIVFSEEYSNIESKDLWLGSSVTTPKFWLGM